jgi:23S rRNA (guanine745-N1)-methyltransferase
MNFTVYKCPVCGKQLSKRDNSYSCSQKHTYDIAKEGYVNLLLANQMKSKDPGDSKEMMIARNSFLNKGYFERLSDKINSVLWEAIQTKADNNFVAFDAGCGEGYYTDRLYNSIVNTNEAAGMCGMDISKEAVKIASKRNKNICYCVGSIYHLPILDSSVDYILNVFAPFKEEEFLRVLKQDGVVLKVTPGAQHLMGLKKALYDNPYLNHEELPQLASFEVIESISLRYEIQLNHSDDIVNLLKMTPYFWNTNINKTSEFIQNTTKLETELDFVVTVLKRRNEA